MQGFMSRQPEAFARKILRGHGCADPPPGESRKQLARRYVSEVVNIFGCCVDDACPCARAGVECHSETCGCISKEEAVVAPRKSGRTPSKWTPMPNKPACNNKMGRYKYDEKEVTVFRKNRLRQLRGAGEQNLPQGVVA